MTLVIGITVFVLAAFVGFEIITKVPPQLHTPLMSGSNAISGITVIGAIVVAGSGDGTTAAVLGFVHPRTKADLRFELHLPADMQQALDTLTRASTSRGPST